MHASEVKKYWLRQIVVDMNAIYQMTENELIIKGNCSPTFQKRPAKLQKVDSGR